MSDDAQRRQIGPNDGPVEDELERSFEAVVTEGAERLHRTARAVLVTGLFGGIEVSVGIMVMLAVLHETGNHLLAGVAFAIGLIAIYLAHSELFTEDFLMPIAAVVSRDGRLRDLGKLWIGTLAANLVGGAIMMWIVTRAFPEWSATLAESAEHFVHAPLNLQSICLAVLGGSTMTLLTRMQQGTDSPVARIVACVGAAFLLAGLQLFHSVLDSLLIFGGIFSGADVGIVDWLQWFWYAVLFNIVGGVVLVTSLRLLRTKELVEEEREHGKYSRG
jgi:formate/nitrite transporter FocA (FNT family)